MNLNKIVKVAHQFSRPFRVGGGGKFRLKKVDPEDTLHLDSGDRT